jgi:hypothetical protein
MAILFGIIVLPGIVSNLKVFSISQPELLLGPLKVLVRIVFVKNSGGARGGGHLPPKLFSAPPFYPPPSKKLLVTTIFCWKRSFH